MILCGISISSSEATLVWLDDGSLQLIGAHKVLLTDPYDPEDLARTGELIRQFLVEKKTELVVVRKSSIAGKFGAGHIAFRLETVIAMSVPCDLAFVSPQSVAAFVKRENSVFPCGLKKYQQNAYLVALTKIG